jgi:hypothetical protein
MPGGLLNPASVLTVCIDGQVCSPACLSGCAPPFLDELVPIIDKSGDALDGKRIFDELLCLSLVRCTRESGS